MSERKGFVVKHSYNNDFVELINNLKEKYPEEVFKIQGIHNDSLDINKFSKKFFEKSVGIASASIDANANVKDKTICDYNYESPKAMQKINSIYLMYKWVKKIYGVKDAKIAVEKVISGEIFVNDLTSFHMPYCFAFDLDELIVNGFKAYKGLDIKPPKRSDTFIQLLIQATAYFSNQIVGASSYPNFFPILDWFYRNEIGEDYIEKLKYGKEKNTELYNKIKNQFQNLIYSFNFPFRGNQSAFTNLSIMDDGFLHSLFDNYTLPDGTKINFETTKELSKMFFVYFNEIFGKEGVFTFPVLTLAISLNDKKEYMDYDFVKWCAKENHQKAVSNIFQDKPTSFSSCCFNKDQNILTKSSSGVLFDTFENIYNLSPYDSYKKNFTIYHNGSWVKGNIIKVPVNNKKLYKITTANNKEIITTEDHINVTDNGDISTSKLTTDNYLAFNSRKLDSFPERCQKLTYEQGFLIGLYLGDGSKYKKKNCNSYEITFSLNESNISDLKNIETALKQWGIEKEIHTYWQNNTMLTKVFSEDLYNIISEYINGDYAYEKELNMNILLQSVDFRRGICFGWYASDGGNSLRIYTTSEKIIPQAEALFNSIGLNTVVNISDRTGENNVIIRGKEFSRNYPLYCIRWYDMKNKRSMKDVYKVVNNTEYFKITNIQEVEYNNDYVYCFEMKNEDEPYFTLPNGIITHNCRLKNDFSKLASDGVQNSFGVSGVNIGSLRVCGLNLARLGMLEKSNPNILSENIDIIHKILYSQRQLIKKRIESGLLPLYTTNWINIRKQYSTIGLVAMNEYIENLGMDIINEDGLNKALETVSYIEKEALKWEDEERSEGCIYNIESIPAESMAVRLAKLDSILGYNNKNLKLYSNQYIPLIKDASLYDRARVQGKMDALTSGGAILHVTVFDDKGLTEEQYLKVMNDMKNLGVSYFGVNYCYSECENGHVSIGDNLKCPKCDGEIIEKYSRVVGFVTPKGAWNDVRKNYEFQRRKSYSFKEGLNNANS